MAGKKVGVNFGVANAIGGVDEKFAGWDYTPMLPRVCSLFKRHIETIKRKFTPTENTECIAFTWRWLNADVCFGLILGLISTS